MTLKAQFAKRLSIRGVSKNTFITNLISLRTGLTCSANFRRQFADIMNFPHESVVTCRNMSLSKVARVSEGNNDDGTYILSQ